MGSEPEPRTYSKGEAKRQLIYRAIKHHYIVKKVDPTIQDIQEMTGIRSFNTLTKQLKHLTQDGVIEWNHHSPTVKLLTNDYDQVD
jgi:SOS-response transcriptional repressor LexA